MTDEAFRSADGRDLRVTMSGLNAGNKAAMLECLSRYYSTGSNILWLSGWAKRVNDGGSYDPSTGKAFTSEDDIFDFYTSRFNVKKKTKTVTVKIQVL